MGDSNAFTRNSQEDQIQMSKRASQGSDLEEVQKHLSPDAREVSPEQDEHSKFSRTEFASPVAFKQLTGSFRSIGKSR